MDRRSGQSRTPRLTILCALRFASTRSTALAWALSIASFAGLVAIASRVPLSEGDDAFYASIVRAADTPAFDYVRFYGPVFFRIVGASFDVFGFSIGSLRAVSLLGALLIASAGLMLARTLGADAPHRAWACALLVLSPEWGWAATSGRMDALAVGLELLGLAVLARGLAGRRRPWKHGIAGGVLLASAALTTPRTFPFMFSLLVGAAAVLPFTDGRMRRSASRLLAVAAVTSLMLFGAWLTLGAGGAVSWLRIMWSIATHQRDDVALLPGTRILSFGWSRVVTPAVGIIAALLFARQRGHWTAQMLAARFALVTVWTTFVVTAVLFGMTLFFGTYFVVPLFAVVLALPWDARARGDAGARLPLVTVVAIALLAFFGTVRVAKHVRAAITWTARDPVRVEGFVRAYVPPGSVVVGPHFLYFFPVERAGSRYRTANQVSWADWTQWIPPGDRSLQPLPRDRARQRLILWPTDETLVFGQAPRGRCGVGAAVATYEPPPPDLPGLSGVAALDDLRGYPRATLYRTNDQCGTEP